MPANQWTQVLNDDQLEEGVARLVPGPGPGILVIKKEGAVYALQNRCPHMDCPLVRGRLEGFVLQCPCHDWKFDIRNGEFLAAREIKAGTYPCKTEGGKVLVFIPEKA